MNELLLQNVSFPVSLQSCLLFQECLQNSSISVQMGERGFGMKFTMVKH